MNDNSIYFRPLRSADITTVQRLCHEWFPICYGSEFFQQVVQPGDFYSLAGVDLATGEIASLAVAEVVGESDLNAEDCPNLPFTLAAEERRLIYIRILGVSSRWRGRGLGTELLSRVAAFALEEGACCIYLHVLSSNEPALSLYRKNVTDAMAISGYEEQLSLPDYYQLGPSTADALLLTRMLVPQATSLFSQYVVLAWESLFQELISWSTELCLETRDLSIGQ